MSEFPPAANRSPRVPKAELQAVAWHVIDKGRQENADYPDLQPTTETPPSIYVLTIQSNLLQEYKDRRVENQTQGQYEKISGVTLIYSDARILYGGGMTTAQEAMMSVLIESGIYPHQLANEAIANKSTLYFLPMNPDHNGGVMEMYTDTRGERFTYISDNPDRDAQQVERESRPLSDDDVKMLRYLFSHR